jgi:cytoskeletal protein CcmA (bactofilin family)
MPEPAPDRSLLKRWHQHEPDRPDRDRTPLDPGEAEASTVEIETKEARMAGPDDPQVSVVSRGTKIEGSVMAAGSLRVEGEVLGNITARGEVSLSPHGRVQANIKAERITLAGQVKGDLEASGDVSLPAESRLDGNIRARNADVGGVVDGDVTVDGKASLGPRARVEGDITSSSLAIAEGAVFIGRSVMQSDKDDAETGRLRRRAATAAAE